MPLICTQADITLYGLWCVASPRHLFISLKPPIAGIGLLTGMPRGTPTHNFRSGPAVAAAAADQLRQRVPSIRTYTVDPAVANGRWRWRQCGGAAAAWAVDAQWHGALRPVDSCRSSGNIYIF